MNKDDASSIYTNLRPGRLSLLFLVFGLFSLISVQLFGPLGQWFFVGMLYFFLIIACLYTWLVTRKLPMTAHLFALIFVTVGASVYIVSGDDIIHLLKTYFLPDIANNMFGPEIEILIDDIFGRAAGGNIKSLWSADEALLNIIILVFFAVFTSVLAGVIASVISLITRKSEENEKHNLTRHFIPALNNHTVSYALGLTTAIFTCGVVFFRTYYFVKSAEPVDGDFLANFPWPMVVAPLIYLSYLAHRTEPEESEEVRLGALSASKPMGSSFKYFKKIHERAMEASALAYPEGKVDEGSVPPLDDTWREAYEKAHETNLEMLLKGKIINFEQSLNYEVLRLVTEAISACQDRGQVSIIVCPNHHASNIDKKLKSIGVDDLASNVRRTVVLKSGDGNAQFDTLTVHDLIIAGEHAFHNQLIASHGIDEEGFQVNTLDRLGLLVFLDLHNLNPSRLRTTFLFMGNVGRLKKCGVLMQGLKRQPVDALKSTILSGHDDFSGNPNLEIDANCDISRHSKKWEMVVKPSSEFKSAMLAPISKLIDDTPVEAFSNFQLENFFSLSTPELIPSSKHRALGVFLEQDALDQSDSESFKKEMSKVSNKNIEFHADTIRGASLVSSDKKQVLVLEDRGHLYDSLAIDSTFDPATPDFCSIVVSYGYPGREYLLSNLNKTKKELAESLLKEPKTAPFAPLPGTGIAEVANRLLSLMKQKNGLNEKEAERLISMASGKLFDSIGVGSTRRGLNKLFSLLGHAHNTNVVETQDNRQNSVFHDHDRESLSGVRYAIVTEDGSKRENVTLLIADQGLLFDVGSDIAVGARNTKIESIDRERSTISVRAQGGAGLDETGHLPEYIFHRKYSLVVKEELDDELVFTFVTENAASPSTRINYRFQIVQIHTKVKRLSTDWTSCSIESDQTNLLAVDHNQCLPAHEFIRPFRSTMLLVFDHMDAIADLPKLGRTLAASLQTVLGLAFPRQRRRIAVFPLEAANENLQAEDAHRLAYYLYPKGNLEGADIVEVMKRCYQLEKAENTEMFQIDENCITLAVIEDADEDLGVSRRCFSEHDAIIRHWIDFLDWASKEDDWNNNGLFDAKFAMEFLNNSTDASAGSPEHDAAASKRSADAK